MVPLTAESETSSTYTEFVVIPGLVFTKGLKVVGLNWVCFLYKS